jgi:hypothetical protein
LDQAIDNSDYNHDDYRDDDKLVNRQPLNRELGLSGLLLLQISLPTSEPVASKSVASKLVVRGTVRSTRLRKRTQAAIEVEDEPVIWVSKRKRQKRVL